jgi:hypothetical protein
MSAAGADRAVPIDVAIVRLAVDGRSRFDWPSRQFCAAATPATNARRA